MKGEAVNLNEINENINNWDDILIVFHSLIQCIIEYSNIEESFKKKLIKIQKYSKEINSQDIFLIKLLTDLNLKKKDGKKNIEIDETTNKSFFILNTFSLLDFLRLETLNNKDLNLYNIEMIDSYLYFFWSKIFILIKIYFSVIVLLDKNKLLKFRMDKIKEDKEILFNLYIENI